MGKRLYITAAALFITAVCITDVQADDAVNGAPAIVETVNGTAKVLLNCTNDQMPVMTEGPTEEIQAGQETHYDHGILKCADITETVRNGDAGGSGSASFTDGRKLEVINCPKGTSPFVLELDDKTKSLPITRDPKKPVPSEYVAYAPVTVRCMETVLLEPHN